MSDTMLLGVLRMPMPDNPGQMTLRQFVDRARQAADRIETDAQRIAALEAALEQARVALAERDEVLEIARQALESHMAQTRVIQRSVDALRAIEEVR